MKSFVDYVLERYDYKSAERGDYLSITFNNYINKLKKDLDAKLKSRDITVVPYKSYDGSDSVRFSYDKKVEGTITINEVFRNYIYLDKSRTELNVRFLDRTNQIKPETEKNYSFDNEGLKKLTSDILEATKDK